MFFLQKLIRDLESYTLIFQQGLNSWMDYFSLWKRKPTEAFYTYNTVC